MNENSILDCDQYWNCLNQYNYVINEQKITEQFQNIKSTPRIKARQ